MTQKGFKRKLSAILSADVEGYSRLMSDDEEATVRTLKNYRKVMTMLIQQHNGRVIDSPGDNLLAEFGSVVDAVQCSFEIQQVLKAKNDLLPENRRMEFRIGVNLGDVIEEEDQIYGEGVNIASRVEGLAEAGGISISGSAYEQIENKLPLKYVYLGEYKVKNIRKSIKVYHAQIDQNLSTKEKFLKKSILSLKPGLLGALSVIFFVIVALLIWKYFVRSSAPIADVSFEKRASSIATKNFTDTSIGFLKVKLIKQNWSIMPAGTKAYAGGKEYSIKEDLAGIDLILRISNTSSEKIIIPNWILLDKNKDPVAPFRLTEKDGKKYIKEKVFIHGNKTKLIYLRSTYKSLNDKLKGEPLFLVDRGQNFIWPLMRIPDRATLLKNRQSKIKN